MVEIRVSVEDGSNAAGLVRRLAGLFGRSSTSFDRARKVVQVESEWEESRAFVTVLEIVVAWLEEDGAETATLSLGEYFDTLARSIPLAVSR